MRIVDIIAQTNKLLDGANHTYSQLVYYFDNSVDEINEELWSELPLVSEGYNTIVTQEDIDNNPDLDLVLNQPWGEDWDYDVMPDRFIRNYMCYSAAADMLAEEEEVTNLFFTYTSMYEKWFDRIISSSTAVDYSNDGAILINGDATTYENNAQDLANAINNYYWEND